jgi:hypothetical protein
MATKPRLHRAASETENPEALDPVDNEFRKRLFSYASKVIEALMF